MRGIVAHAFNASTWQADASQTLRIQRLLGLHSKLQDSQNYKVRLCLEKEEGGGGRGGEREKKYLC